MPPSRMPLPTRIHAYSTRSAAALVIAAAAIVTAFGSRNVSIDPAASAPTPPGTEIAFLPTSTPTTEPTGTIALLSPTPTMTAALTVPPTATLAPTEIPTLTPTEFVHPTVPPSGNDTESMIYERGNPNKKQIAFTFDAGEGPGYVTQILDLFEKYGIHGSFGVTGNWAEQNPDLVKRMVDDGNIVFNHTLNHKSFTGYSTGAPALTDQERTDEIVQANDAIVAASGQDTRPFFRFPYNDYDEQALVLLKQLGYDYTLGYTCDTLGWNGNTADQIIQLCGPDAPKGGPGGIILMHVVQEQDFLALEPLIQAYLDDGYEIVTMDVMIGS
ncbi:MAG: polysaccharide deacetylase family protein [Thermomicrobiales bacterium]